MERATDLDVIGVWALPVGGGDAGLDSLDPCLPQLLRLSLQHAAPVAHRGVRHIHSSRDTIP